MKRVLSLLKKVNPLITIIVTIVVVVWLTNKVIDLKGALFSNNIPTPTPGDTTAEKALKKAYVDGLAKQGKTPSLLESVSLYLDSLWPF